jgi:hypothetical protein
MEEIQIFNDFLDPAEIDICKDIINSHNWGYGHTSVRSNFLSIPFWNMKLYDNEFLKETIKSKIEKVTNKKFKVILLYANGQTYGQDGSFHQDGDFKEENSNFKKYTFCLYLTDFPIELCDIIGGNFEIKIPNINDYTISINPIFNRGIFFPSYYFHRGNSFNRFTHELRVSIAWKLEEI